MTTVKGWDDGPWPPSSSSSPSSSSFSVASFACSNLSKLPYPGLLQVESSAEQSRSAMSQQSHPAPQIDMHSVLSALANASAVPAQHTNQYDMRMAAAILSKSFLYFGGFDRHLPPLHPPIGN